MGLIYLRLVRLIFGEEGDVAADPRAQALIVANTILVTGGILLSPLITDLGTVFSVSDSRAGLLIIVYTATLTVFLPVAGVLADRLGRKAVTVPGLAVFAIAGSSIGFVDTFEVALGLRVLQGIGAAGARPIVIAVLGDLYNGAREATVQSVRVTFDSVVNTAVPIVAGLLFVASWRYPFFVFLLGIPVAAWLWFALPEVDVAVDQSLRAYVRDLLTVVSDRTIGPLMLSFFVRMTLMYGLFTYVSVLAIREAGLAVVVVGTLLAVRSVTKVVSSAQAGRLTTTYDPVLLTLLGFALAGFGLLLMGAFPMEYMLFVGVAIYGLGDGLLSPIQKSVLNQLAPPEYRGGAMSGAYTFEHIGKTLGPLGLGIVLTVSGPAFAFVLLGAAGGLAGVGLSFVVWLHTR